MGHTCSNLGKSQRKHDLIKDLGNLDDNLKFKVMINNIKLKNSPPESSHIRIEFGIHKQMNTSRMLGNLPNYSFDFLEEFEYTMIRNNLHHHNMKMTLIDKSGIERAHVNIKLYDIATGPPHNDHLLKVNSKVIGRLTFDCRMSQIINVLIRPEVIVCQLLENPKEREYNFSLKLTSNHKEFLSEHSENFKNPLWGERHHPNSDPQISNDQNNNHVYHYSYNQNQNDNQNNNNALKLYSSSHLQNQSLLLNQNSTPHPINNEEISKNNQPTKREPEVKNDIVQKSEFEDELFDYNPTMEENKKLKKSEMNKTLIPESNNLQNKYMKLLSNDATSPDLHTLETEKLGHEKTSNQTISDQQVTLNINDNNKRAIDGIQSANMNDTEKATLTSIKHSRDNNRMRHKTNAPKIHQSNAYLQPVASSHHVGLPNLPEINLAKSQTVIINHNHGALNHNSKKEVHWNYRISMDDPPILEMELNVHDIASNSFQFFLWAIKETEQLATSNIPQQEQKNSQNSVEDSNIYIDHKLIGECYVSLYKIYSEEDERKNDTQQKEISSPLVSPTRKSTIKNDGLLKTNTNQEFRSSTTIRLKNFHTNRISDFNEKLWYHGVCVGTFKGEFCVSNEIFYRQMLCGVMSDNGPLKSAQLILKKPQNLFSVFTNTIPKEVKTLSTIKDNLNDTVFKLAKEQDSKIQKKLLDELAKNLVQIPDLLKVSYKESMVSYMYHSEEDLLASQTTFIDLASHMLEYCDEAPISLKSTYLESLILIVNRGEFELDFMGFNHGYADVILQNAGDASLKNDKTKLDAIRNINQKLKVCLNYQNMLYNMLDKVLHKLTQKKLDDKEREFVEHFCAIAYFRIPEFRDKLLECLIQSSNQSNIAIEEWRGTEWKLDNETKNYNKNKDFISLFDWQKDFYRFLKDTPKGEDNFKHLMRILSNEEWYRRMAKRGIAFYFFLNEWAKHVSKTVVIKEQVPWQDLPGYNVLVKAFLIELKIRDVKHYPEALMAASISLLKNEKLLSVFVTILYKKTNIFDSMAIFSVFERINEWFQTLIKNKKKIPLTFDNLFFVKGITLIVDGEHALNIAKVLWVIYNNFNLFNVEVKRHLCGYLLNDAFCKLFLHWSWNVRQIFHHLLLYRIYHQHRRILTGVTNVSEAKRALYLAHDKGQSLNRSEKENLLNDIIHLEYQRNFELFEKLKTKAEKENDMLDYQRKYENKIQAKGRRNSCKNSINIGVKPPLRRYSCAANLLSLQPDLLQSLLSEPSQNTNKKKSNLTSGDSKLNMSVNDLFISTDKNTQNPAFGNSVDFGAIKVEQNMFDGDGAKSSVEVQDVGVKSMVDDMIDNKDDGSPEKNISKQKVVINRRFFLGKDFSQQLNTILKDGALPKEMEVYLLRSWQEYDKTRQSYKNWVHDINEKLSMMSENERKASGLDTKVPELQVKIPLDDAESDRIEFDDEW